MQYLKEMPTGIRIPVNSTQFMVDESHRNFQQIIAHPSMIVYRILGMPQGKPEERLFYGGRGRGGRDLPWNGA